MHRTHAISSLLAPSALVGIAACSQESLRMKDDAEDVPTSEIEVTQLGGLPAPDVRNDLDSDGRGDVFWFNADVNRGYVWLMNGGTNTVI